MSEQSFSNHGKIVPTFHFFVIPVLVLNVIWDIVSISRISAHSAISLTVLTGFIVSILVSIALLVLAFLARIFALGVQDRVIRLEERIRYERLLPEDLKARIGEFTINQLVSLRCVPLRKSYKMLRMTPPSAFTAAPLMLADCVLATNATTAAISSVVSKRFSSELGRTLSKNSFSTCSFETACCNAID